MKKTNLLLFIGISILIGLIFSCKKSFKNDVVTKISSNKNFVVYESAHAKLSIEKDYLTQEEIVMIATKIENGITVLSEYLGDKLQYDLQNSKVVFIIKSGQFISHTVDDLIELSFVKKDKSPYLHELVHVLLGKNGNMNWLSEGIAIFLNDYLSGDPCFPNWGKDIDTMAKELLNGNPNSKILSFDNKYFSTMTVDINLRRAAYILVGSFAKYLEITYGKEILLNAFLTENLDTFGVPLEKIKSDWIKSLGI